MSCLTFVQSANEIWMASDRALVSQIDGKWIRLRSDYSKLFIFNSCAYFICGDISASNILKELVLGGYSNEYISNYAREHNYAVEIVCSRLLDGEIITDNYSFLNNFKKNTIVCNYVGAFSIGIETERATNLLEKCYNEFNSNPLNYFKHVYNKLCEQRIGGSLDIIHISSNGIEMLYSDLDDPYYSNKDTGLVAGDALVGKILAGTTLQITTGDKSFTIDENGAVLNNAKFEITTDSGKAKIILSPKDGIKVQQLKGNTWKDKFYVDTNGNAVFAGKITANEGTIGGWDITTEGLSSGENYLNSDGNIHFGKLDIQGDVATFDGWIWAKNLQDQVQTIKIADSAVTNDKVENGTLDYSKTNEDFGGKIAVDKVFTTALIANEAYIKDLVTTKAFITNAVVKTLQNNDGGKQNVVINKSGIEAVYIHGDKITTGSLTSNTGISIDAYNIGVMQGGKNHLTIDTNGGVVNTSGLYCGDIGYPGSGNSAIKIVQGNGVQFKQSVVFNEGKIINFDSRRVNFSNNTDIYFWEGKLDWATVSTPGGGTVDAIIVHGF